MTINELQKQLIEEIENITKDMSLINKKGEIASLKGYSQAIPILPVFEAVPYDAEEVCDLEEDAIFPYFIVRVDGVEYQKEETQGLNQAHLMIAIAIYDDDLGLRGYFTLTAVMERIITRFQENTALGPFYCSRRMNAAYQEDDTFPQFFGALEMIWNLPDVGMGQGMEELWNTQGYT